MTALLRGSPVLAWAGCPVDVQGVLTVQASGSEEPLAHDLLPWLCMTLLSQ